MCLAVVNENFPLTSFIQDGWKEFFESASGTLSFAAFRYKGQTTVPLNTWIKAESTPVRAEDGVLYESGFHVYEHEHEVKRGARRAVRRVYYRGAYTRGKQDKLTVVIARELYVPSDPNGWPPHE